MWVFTILFCKLCQIFLNYQRKTLGEKLILFLGLFFLRFYIFISIERGREGERGEKHQCVRETSSGCYWSAPWPAQILQPRHVPWWGMELATFRFARWQQTSHTGQSFLALPRSSSWSKGLIKAHVNIHRTIPKTEPMTFHNTVSWISSIAYGTTMS